MRRESADVLAHAVNPEREKAPRAATSLTPDGTVPSMPRTGAAAARLRGILTPPPPPPPPAVTVLELPGRGRCLLASRDIAKGEARTLTLTRLSLQ